MCGDDNNYFPLDNLMPSLIALPGKKFLILIIFNKNLAFLTVRSEELISTMIISKSLMFAENFL